MFKSVTKRVGSIKESVSNASLAEFLLPFLALLIVAGALLAGSSNSKQPSQGDEIPPQQGSDEQPLRIKGFKPFVPDTFKIVFEYNLKKDEISLKEMTIMSDHIRTDIRLSHFSEYEIGLFDASSRQLYRSKVTINQIIFDIPADQMFDSLPSFIYLSYDSRATKLVLYHKDQEVLSVPVLHTYEAPKEMISIETTQSCGPLKVVILGDGYNSQGDFQANVNSFISAISGTQGYESSGSLFSFVTYQNTQNTTCMNSIFSCIGNSALHSAVEKAKIDTGASTAVVLVNGGGRSVGGVSVGEGPAIINTLNPGWPMSFMVRHEFLGHMIGKLYDRYSTSGVPVYGDLRSNCTDNPAGEPFWKDAGSTGVYQACTTPNTYSPFPNTCGASGNPSTAMGGCVSNPSDPQFDAVEQKWIREVIVPVLKCQSPTLDNSGGGQSNNNNQNNNNNNNNNQNNNNTPTATPTTTVPNCSGANQIACGGTCFSVSTCATGWVCLNGLPACNPVPTSTTAQTYSKTISWGAMPGATGGYEVRFIAGTTNTGIVYTYDTSFTFNNLTSGSYNWTIWALDTSGNRTGENSGAGGSVP